MKSKKVRVGRWLSGLLMRLPLNSSHHLFESHFISDLILSHFFNAMQVNESAHDVSVVNCVKELSFPNLTKYLFCLNLTKWVCFFFSVCKPNQRYLTTLITQVISLSLTGHFILRIFA